MKELLSQPKKSLALYLGLLMIVSLLGLGRWGLIESSEARYAEISREMFLTGNWIHPELLGIRHYHKPPVTYWITSAGYALFGIHEFGARFFLTVSYLLQIVLLFFITRKILMNERAALLAAVLYSSFPVVLVSVRGLTTDSYLTTFVLASIAAWIQWRSTAKPVWIYTVSLCLAMAFLTKGPVVLLVPVLVMLGLKLPEAKQSSFTLHHLVAIVVFLVVALSWFFMLVAEDNVFIDYFLFRHTVERFAAAEVFKRTAPWWYYLVYAPLLALPWTFVFFFRRNTSLKEEQKIVNRLLIYWVLIPLLFFSLSSSKLVLYILPLYAGFAMVCAYRIFSLSEQQKQRWANVVYGFDLMLIVAVMVYSFIPGQLELPLWLVVFAVIVVVLLTAIHFRKTDFFPERITAYAFLLTVFLLISSAEIMRLNEIKVNGTRPVSDWLYSEGLGNRPVLVYDRLLPSLSFNLNKPIITIQDGHHTVMRETQFEENNHWKDNLFDLRDPKDSVRLLELLQQPSVMIIRKDFRDDRKWLRQYYVHEKSFEPWVVLY